MTRQNWVSAAKPYDVAPAVREKIRRRPGAWYSLRRFREGLFFVVRKNNQATAEHATHRYSRKALRTKLTIISLNQESGIRKSKVKIQEDTLLIVIVAQSANVDRTNDASRNKRTCRCSRF